MIGKGRTKIVCGYTEEELKNTSFLISAINTAFSSHFSNKSDISYLMDYRNGRQTVLNRVKNVRPEIKNTLVINHAQMITRMITGYFLGTPIQYTLAGSKYKKDIDLLNKYVEYEDKASVDLNLCETQSICGTAYRLIYSDGFDDKDEVPFETRDLNPLQTFVVYENTVRERPLFAVYYYPKKNENSDDDGMVLNCYTRFGVYEFTVDTYEVIPEDAIPTFTPYNVGGVPIVEYPNNMWRIGDWELCIGLMDAINSLQSGRLDDIDQTVQSLLVFINADINEDVYDEMRRAGIVSLKNTTNAQTEIQSVDNKLDQSGINMMSSELEKLLYAMIGIPDRNNRAGGGGDTGQAVELRDGWADLEIIARNKELVFEKSEKQTLKIILTILKSGGKFKVTPLDVRIKFSRNKNNNLLVKTQAYTNLLSTKTLSPADCLTIVDLVSDTNDFINRGEVFWGEQFAGKTVEKEEDLEIGKEDVKKDPKKADKKEKLGKSALEKD